MKWVLKNSILPMSFYKTFNRINYIYILYNTPLSSVSDIVLDLIRYSHFSSWTYFAYIEETCKTIKWTLKILEFFKLICSVCCSWLILEYFTGFLNSFSLWLNKVSLYVFYVKKIFEICCFTLKIGCVLHNYHLI